MPSVGHGVVASLIDAEARRPPHLPKLSLGPLLRAKRGSPTLVTSPTVCGLRHRHYDDSFSSGPQLV
jgi:hypothetical protein